MNNYSLAADSRRWWWLPATAGAIGTAALTAILVVPATGSVSPVPVPTTTMDTADQPTVVERPCFMARPDWTTRRWDYPVCTTVLHGQVEQSDLGHARPAPDALP